MEYILFVGQEANFQSRTILIPYEKFLSVRSEDYKILKMYSFKNIKFQIDNECYNVDNLLLINFIRNGNIGTLEESEHSRICCRMIQYADSSDYCDDKDKPWLKDSKFELCGGFNHIKNYCNLIKNSPYKIVDSFLCLSTDDGKMNFSPVDTVLEMYEKYFSLSK